MTTFTVSTYTNVPYNLAASDWLVVSRFGTIGAFNNMNGAVVGGGANAIQVDGVVSNGAIDGSGIRLATGNNTVVVGTAGLVQGGAAGLHILSGTNTISVAGMVKSFDGTGIVTNGLNDTITIEATGTVLSETGGLNVGGNLTFRNFGTVISTGGNGMDVFNGGNSITNAGTIEAGNLGVVAGLLGAAGSNSIVNTGTVRSGNSGVVAGLGENALFNTGTIESLFFDAYFSNGTNAVINNGQMFSRAAFGLSLGNNADAVVNNGFLQGNGTAALLAGGNDLFDGRNGVQVGIVNGGAGNDTIYGGAQSDMLVGGADNDTLHGMDGTDALAGGDGVDTLHGGNGADTLFGEAGSDLILGGAGGDVIRGGLGGDLIGFNAGDNGDLIQNFNEGGVRDGFDLRGYFNATGFTGTNPRAAGVMAVLQNGADTDVYLHGAFAFRIQGVVAAAIDDSYFLFQ